MYLAICKFFSCQSLFHNTTLWLRDSGILNKLYENELNTAGIIPDPKLRVNQPLNIYQLATAFLLVAGGLTLGILAFFVESSLLRRKIKTYDINKVWTNIFILLAFSHYEFSLGWKACHERYCRQDRWLNAISWMRLLDKSLSIPYWCDVMLIIWWKYQ